MSRRSRSPGEALDVVRILLSMALWVIVCSPAAAAQRVAAVSAEGVTLSWGERQGVREGMTGRLCTMEDVGGKAVEVCVALFRIASASGSRATAVMIKGDIEEVQPGFLALFDQALVPPREPAPTTPRPASTRAPVPATVAPPGAATASGEAELARAERLADENRCAEAVPVLEHLLLSSTLGEMDYVGTLLRRCRLQLEQQSERERQTAAMRQALQQVRADLAAGRDWQAVDQWERLGRAAWSLAPEEAREYADLEGELRPRVCDRRGERWRAVVAGPEFAWAPACATGSETMGLWVADRPVTRSDLLALFPDLPAPRKSKMQPDDRCARELIEWSTAVEYANLLSREAGRSYCYELELCFRGIGNNRTCGRARRVPDCSGFWLATLAELETIRPGSAPDAPCSGCAGLALCGTPLWAGPENVGTRDEAGEWRVFGPAPVGGVADEERSAPRGVLLVTRSGGKP